MKKITYRILDVGLDKIKREIVCDNYIAEDILTLIVNSDDYQLLALGDVEEEEI